MKYKCIIFDCDGVLVDSEPIANKVLLEMLKKLGEEIDFDFLLEHFSGKSLQAVFDYVESKMGKALPNDFEANYRKHTFAAFQNELQAIEGVHDLLERMTLPYCVASSGPVEKIKLNLKTTALLSYFENRIYSAYEIGSWKPDPGIFLHAAKEMGFSPQDCAVIEDSQAGIDAAKAGGFDVYVYRKTLPETLPDKEKIVYFNDMNLLDGLLNL